jgi:hypothetical protein
VSASSGRRRRRRNNTIDEAFAPHRRSMKESVAWRALPDNARRVLDRLELEHMRQGARENGRLICTYTDFEEWALRRKSIARALREAVALGFLEITGRGYKAATGFRQPSTYRVTYL